MVPYYYLTVVLSTCLWVALGQTLMSLKFRTRINTILHMQDVDMVITVSELGKCLTLCKTMSHCQTVSWSAGRCLMSQNDKTHETKGVLATDDNWTTMLRVVYPVFLMAGHGGKHTLTFAEGKAMCEAGGRKLASRQDMLDARTMGFQLCRCGWLSDGTKAFVLQEPNVCTPLWNNGIIEGCSFTQTADIYCKV